MASNILAASRPTLWSDDPLSMRCSLVGSRFLLPVRSVLLRGNAIGGVN